MKLTHACGYTCLDTHDCRYLLTGLSPSLFGRPAPARTPSSGCVRVIPPVAAQCTRITCTRIRCIHTTPLLCVWDRRWFGLKNRLLQHGLPHNEPRFGASDIPGAHVSTFFNMLTLSLRCVRHRPLAENACFFASVLGATAVVFRASCSDTVRCFADGDLAITRYNAVSRPRAALLTLLCSLLPPKLPCVSMEHGRKRAHWFGGLTGVVL